MIKVGAGRAWERLTPFFRLEQLALRNFCSCVTVYRTLGLRLFALFALAI